MKQLEKRKLAEACHDINIPEVLRQVEQRDRTECGPDGIYLMMRKDDQIVNLTTVLKKASLDAYLMILRILKVTQ